MRVSLAMKTAAVMLDASIDSAQATEASVRAK